MNYIFQDLFRDTPLAHIWRSQILAQIQPYTAINGQIRLSGVSLKISCKMQFRRVDLVSIGTPSQKFGQISFLPDFPIVTILNVKLKWVAELRL